MRPFNGRIKVMLELDGLEITREEVIDINTEEILQVPGVLQYLYR